MFYFPLILNDGCDIYSFCYRKSPIDIQPVKKILQLFQRVNKHLYQIDRSINILFVFFSLQLQKNTTVGTGKIIRLSITHIGVMIQPTHISTCALGGLNSTMDMTQHQKQSSFP